MDRAKMRELVFADASAKAKLEAIVHPLIQQGMQDQINSATHAGRALIVLDLPLLAERTGFAGWRPKLDAVWVVDCPEEVQIARVKARSGMTEAQIRAVMQNQSSRQGRLAIADVVITNDSMGLNVLRSVVVAAIIPAL
jgi:dephospho-CoA kinase